MILKNNFAMIIDGACPEQIHKAEKEQGRRYHVHEYTIVSPWPSQSWFNCDFRVHVYAKSCTEMHYKHDNTHESGHKQLIFWTGDAFSAPVTIISVKIMQTICHKSSFCKGVDAKWHDVSWLCAANSQLKVETANQQWDRRGPLCNTTITTHVLLKCPQCTVGESRVPLILA